MHYGYVGMKHDGFFPLFSLQTGLTMYCKSSSDLMLQRNVKPTSIAQAIQFLPLLVYSVCQSIGPWLLLTANFFSHNFVRVKQTYLSIEAISARITVKYQCIIMFTV